MRAPLAKREDKIEQLAAALAVVVTNGYEPARIKRVLGHLVVAEIEQTGGMDDFRNTKSYVTADYIANNWVDIVGALARNYGINLEYIPPKGESIASSVWMVCGKADFIRAREIRVKTLKKLGENHNYLVETNTKWKLQLPLFSAPQLPSGL
jgi:hypothetical protein